MWVCKANKKYTFLTDICLPFFIIFIGALRTISLWRRDLCLVARWWHHCCSLHPLTQPPSQFRHDHLTEPAAPARQDHGQDLPTTTHSPAPRSAGGRRSSRSNNSNGWDPAWSRRRWAVRREPLQLLSTFHCSLCYVLWELDGGKREKILACSGAANLWFFLFFLGLFFLQNDYYFFVNFAPYWEGDTKLNTNTTTNKQETPPNPPRDQQSRQTADQEKRACLYIHVLWSLLAPLRRNSVANGKETRRKSIL